MSPQELSEYLRIPIGTVYQWNHGGTGPKFSKVGKHVRYRKSDIDAWLERNARCSDGT